MSNDQPRNFRKLGAIVLSLSLIGTLGACAAESAPKPAASSTVSTAAMPATPAGERMQWFLDLLNAETDTSAADWEGQVSDAMLAAVSVDQLVSLTNLQLRPAKPFVATDYEGTDLEATAVFTGELGEPFQVNLSVGPDGVIGGLLLKPVTADVAKPATLDEFNERIDALPMTVRTLVVRTSAAGDESVEFSDGAAEPAPLGSIFKLYVLLAVADAVEAGSLAWDDTLVVSDDNRSLPSGELQNKPNGTEVSVRDAALKMISISDNTATDMLIDAVGRQAVEDAVVKAKHHDPSQLMPFPKTREVFQLAWDAPESTRANWEAATTDERRAILESLPAGTLDITAADVTTEPTWQQHIEWFATAEDVGAVHTALAKIDDDAVDAALTTNHGIALDEKQWVDVQFKGGSNTAVLTGSWRATAADGSALTVVMLGSGDDASGIANAQAEFFALAAGLFEIFG